jgi:hypothetical protein
LSTYFWCFLTMSGSEGEYEHEGGPPRATPLWLWPRSLQPHSQTGLPFALCPCPAFAFGSCLVQLFLRPGVLTAHSSQLTVLTAHSAYIRIYSHSTRAYAYAALCALRYNKGQRCSCVPRARGGGGDSRLKEVKTEGIRARAQRPESREQRGRKRKDPDPEPAAPFNRLASC